MKVAVIDVAASCGGAASILMEFYQYVKKNKTDIEWYFVLSQPLVEPTKEIHVILLPDIKKSWTRRLQFDLFGAEKVLATIRPNLILNFQNTLVRCRDMLQFLYVHQPIPFQKVKYFSFLKKEERIYAVYQYIIGSMIKHSVKKADRVFVQTGWMNEAVSALTAKNKVDIITPQIKISESDVKIPVDVDETCFFFPASKIPYKNHKIVTDAVRILVKRGKTDFSVLFTLSEDEKTEKSADQIRYIGSQNRETIMRMYANKVLVFPSYIETFGLPLAEARAVGGLILAADTPFSREVLNGYRNAYFFNAFDANSLAELMEAVMNQKITVLQLEDQNIEMHDSWELLMKRIEECTCKDDLKRGMGARSSE